jgi:uncharacterized membrane protein YbhN (UPF0104 family)
MNIWRKPNWRGWRRWLTAGFLLLVGVLIIHVAKAIDWSQVWSTLLQLPPSRLALATGLSSLSYLGYAGTDLFAGSALGDRVSRPRAMAIAFVSYAFNQNFGALLGTIGFRLRLYSQQGLDTKSIARIIGLSFVTNWSGYFLLAGISFLAWPLPLPPGWKFGMVLLHLSGLVFLVVLAIYLACSATLRQRRWVLGKLTIEFPPARTVLLQLLLSTAIWLAIFGTLYCLLPAGPGALAVLAVFLVASIIGLISHVPAGLGVIELVYLTLLGNNLPRHEILAGLIAYRAVYYLWPLIPAALLYFWLETGTRGDRPESSAPSPTLEKGK